MLTDDYEPYGLTIGGWMIYLERPGPGVRLWCNKEEPTRPYYMQYNDTLSSTVDLPHSDRRYCVFLLAFAQLGCVADWKEYPAWWDSVPYDDRHDVLRFFHNNYQRGLLGADVLSSGDSASVLVGVFGGAEQFFNVLRAPTMELLRSYAEPGKSVRVGATLSTFCHQDKRVTVVNTVRGEYAHFLYPLHPLPTPDPRPYVALALREMALPEFAAQFDAAADVYRTALVCDPDFPLRGPVARQEAERQIKERGHREPTTTRRPLQVIAPLVAVVDVFADGGGAAAGASKTRKAIAFYRGKDDSRWTPEEVAELKGRRGSVGWTALDFDVAICLVRRMLALNREGTTAAHVTSAVKVINKLRIKCGLYEKKAKRSFDEQLVEEETSRLMQEVYDDLATCPLCFRVDGEVRQWHVLPCSHQLCMECHERRLQVAGASYTCHYRCAAK